MSERIAFGGEEIEVRPLYSIEQLRTFRSALAGGLLTAAHALGVPRERIGHLKPFDLGMLLVAPGTGTDKGRLLKLGCAAITDDLIAQASGEDLINALHAVVRVNKEQLRTLAEFLGPKGEA